MMTHISADVQRITLNASCMMIAGERTEQLDIFCHVSGFASDFLSFVDVELIQLFHGALQLYFSEALTSVISVVQTNITRRHRSLLKSVRRLARFYCMPSVSTVDTRHESWYVLFTVRIHCFTLYAGRWFVDMLNEKMIM